MNFKKLKNHSLWDEYKVREKNQRIWFTNLFFSIFLMNISYKSKFLKRRFWLRSNSSETTFRRWSRRSRCRRRSQRRCRRRSRSWCRCCSRCCSRTARDNRWRRLQTAVNNFIQFQGHQMYKKLLWVPWTKTKMADLWRGWRIAREHAKSVKDGQN